MPRQYPAPGGAGAPPGDGPDDLRELRPLPLLARAGLSDTSPGVGAADVVVYSDGACTGNPGPGGWAALIIDGAHEREISGSDSPTTNQRMELMGAIAGLAAVAGARRVHLSSDSAYVVNCFRQRWWERWSANGWRNAAGQPVANRDLWEQLIAQTHRHDVIWHKVKGHSGEPLNERVDALARAAVLALLASR